MNKYLVKTICVLAVIAFLLLVVQTIDNHDAEVCFENIDKVKIGDTYNQAMVKMKSNVIFLKYDSEICFDNNHSFSCNKIRFHYNRGDDVILSFPSFCYSKKTHKIISVDQGLSP